jgi:glutamate racemase
MQPGVKIHYIADNAYFPYGGKSNDLLVQRALYLSQRLGEIFRIGAP